MSQIKAEIIDLSPEKQSEIVKAIDQQLLREGRILLHPYKFYAQFDNLELRMWMQFRGRYQLPTIELIDWLREKIGDRFAIEVAAGNADLGYHLGIHQTDSWIQMHPLMQGYMYARDAKATAPKLDVEKLETVEAIKKYKPQIAIASWLTQKKKRKERPA
ncbi:hypothetical protein [Chroococcidiopsis sp.]|uniref:hypothetical protein n=1 Tax=Chroococcidiopsis sp. TaxID=3088168 RepID=UPI003F3CBC9A